MQAKSAERRFAIWNNVPPPDVQIVIVPVLGRPMIVDIRVDSGDAHLAAALAAGAAGGALRPRGRAGAAQLVAACALQGCLRGGTLFTRARAGNKPAQRGELGLQERASEVERRRPEVLAVGV